MPQDNLPEDGVPVLDIAQLSVGYRGRQVLDRLDLEIPAGAIYGLLGPNGAGKTTLIRTICGRIKPKSGRISIEGQPNQRKSTLRRVGLVPQEIGLYTHLTVRENLMTFGRLSGLSAADTEEAVKWTERVTRLAERHDQRVSTLSGGWKRRVNIAAAVLHKPALLILDEPTVGVDVDARNELHGVIGDLTRHGMAVLIATHDLDQAETICSRVGFLRNGRIAPAGSPAALLEEAFGSKMLVLVELRRPLLDSQRHILIKAGFEPTNDEMTWSILGNGDNGVSGSLTSRFERLGIDVREIRHRRPGLDALFLKLTRKADKEAAA